MQISLVEIINFYFYSQCRHLHDGCQIEYHQNLLKLLKDDNLFKNSLQRNEACSPDTVTEVWVVKKKNADNGEWTPIDQCEPFPLMEVVGGSLAGVVLLVALGFLAFCIYQVPIYIKKQ